MNGLSIAAAALAVALTSAPAVRVIDGDTIKVSGETIRLVGYDTPEVGHHARCPEERAHGRRATARLKEIVASGPVRLERKPSRDRYGRALAVAYVAGLDVGSILISEGLAVAYTKRVSRIRNHDWCAHLTGRA